MPDNSIALMLKKLYGEPDKDLFAAKFCCACRGSDTLINRVLADGLDRKCEKLFRSLNSSGLKTAGFIAKCC